MVEENKMARKTRFIKGQIVKATHDALGLKKGSTYEIKRVIIVPDFTSRTRREVTYEVARVSAHEPRITTRAMWFEEVK